MPEDSDRDQGADFAQGTVTIRVEPIQGFEASQMQEGPLPLPWGDETTDKRRRLTYFESRVATALYGAGHVGPVRSGRWHSAVTEEQSEDGFRILALELLFLDLHSSLSPIWLAVAHVGCSRGQDLEELCEQIRVHASGADNVSDFASQVVAALNRASACRWQALDRGRRQSSAMHVTPESDGDQDALLWMAASLTRQQDFPTEMDRAFRENPRLDLSDSWDALVLRDGAGFVWKQPVETGSSGESAPDSDVASGFYQRSVVSVRTIYTDTLLLARLQRILLDQMANDVADLDPQSASTEAIFPVTEAALSFRNLVWWEDVALSLHSTRLLESAQQQLRNRQLFGRFADDLEQFREVVSLRELQSLRQSQLAQELIQEQQEGRQVAFERKAKIFASVAVALSLMLSLLALNVYDADAIWGNDSEQGISWRLVLVIVLLTAATTWGVARWLTGMRDGDDSRPPPSADSEIP